MSFEQINISLIKRNARKRGPLSSEAWNDSFNEIIRDLSDLFDKWNNSLYPLLSTVPDGTDDSAVDAFTDGLDSSTVYAKQNSSATSNSRYYNSGKSRPNTIFEQLEALYDAIETSENTLSTQLNTSNSISAADISVSDNGSLITATDVEGALQEIVTAQNTISNSYLPLTGGTLSGNLRVQGQLYSDRYATAVTPSGMTQTIDWDNGNSQTISLDSATGDVTLTLSNPHSGGHYLLKVVQSSGTTRNLIWPASVKWASGSAPTITASASAEDVVRLWYDGSSYYGSFTQDMS